MLGVDLGERRVGFAVTDALGLIASPLKSVAVRSPADALAAILATLSETGAQQVILGHPLGMNGKAGAKAREAEAAAEELRARGATVRLWDERLTTAEAERALKEASLSRKERKARIDAVAAQRILSSYLAHAGNRTD